MLVFPNIVKAGFVVGAQYGEGALIVNGQVTSHYNSVAASYGLQAGVQSFGYAMSPNDRQRAAVSRQERRLGTRCRPQYRPSSIKAKAKSLTTTTLQDDVYAFIFDQKGLMAGLGLQGSKITKLDSK